MNDSYASPQSQLVETATGNGQDLEKALAGDYTINLSDVLSESWAKTKGIKRYVLGAGILMYIAMFAVIMVLALVFGLDESNTGALMIGQLIMQIVIMAIILPVAAGIFRLVLKHIQDQPVEFANVFSGFGKTFPLLITAIVMNIMIMLGFILFIIPGIYLSFAYLMAIPLIVDRDMGPWEALETSRKAITKHWFSMFVFWIVMMLIIIISIIPAGLGLIWTMPMMAVAFAIVYRDIFGIESV